MTRRLEVMVVDDSVVVRKMVTDILTRGGDATSVVTAANGVVALEKMRHAKPDVVILDVEMPEMGGLETLERIRQTYPHLPVLMFSSYTERAGVLTLEALARGASDYVTKPSTRSGGAVSLDSVRTELLGKVRAITQQPEPPSVDVPPPAVPAARKPGGPRCEAIVIAASTGGPNALTEVFAHLRADFPVPVLVVQHMLPMFTRLLAERLDASSGLRVTEGLDGAEIRPGFAFVAPGDHHMEVVRNALGQPTIRLQQGPQENSCRPAADVLFRTAASVYGPSLLGVVLTGMGHDGLRGSVEICAAGGAVFAQDRESSVVYSMPGAVIGAGLAERILPLAEVGPELVRVAGRPIPRGAIQALEAKDGR